MKVTSHTFDPESDAAYGYLIADRGRVAETAEVAPGIIVDWDEHGHPVGVELLNVSRRVADGDLASYLNGLAEGLFAAQAERAAEAAE